MKKAFLLFDHDGVLVDTERLYFEATRTVLADLDIDLEPDEYLGLMATGVGCWGLARERGHSELGIEAGRARRDEIYQHLLTTQPIEIEGVSDVLEELAGSYRMAIVTTSRRTDFDWIHRSRDLVGFFEFVLAREDTVSSKPAPDPYLAALGRFAATPESAVAIEDSSRGLAAALAAGIDCLAIHSEFTAAQDFSGATARLGSIREVPAMLGTWPRE